ncbi:MAG: FecR domain-containing protein [Hyphomonadaceae bacterium]|nr:FecR domain-containing protein [Hyphomonadaceae bacterium]
MDHREPTQAELEAAHWLVVLDEPRVSRQDIDAFQAWLAADETHKRAYDAVSATADKIDAVLATEPVEHEIGHRRTRVPVRPIAIAALSAAAALALFVISPLSPLRDEPGAVYATAPEQERLVRLSDGTTIEMAPGARLRASLEGDERRVRFEEGVALFNVAHDASRPFVVTTRFGDIRVLGTSFVVRLGPDGAITTVLSGRVEARREMLFSPDNSVAASADQEIELGGGAPIVSVLARDALDRRLVWRERMVALDGQSLREAAAEVTRFSGVRFAFGDTATAQVRLSGYVAGDDVEAFLGLLENNVGVSADRRADGVIVLRSD